MEKELEEIGKLKELLAFESGDSVFFVADEEEKAILKSRMQSMHTQLLHWTLTLRSDP